MTTFVAFLKSVPDVIWSGVIASILTLSGVLISNRSNTNRLKLQLKHDSSENLKERTADLRREVYLSAVEELVKANAHLAGLPQLDLTKTNIGDGLQNFFSAAARLQLIAEPKTALLVGQLTAEYGELVFELMTHLMPASRAKSDIQISDDLYNKSQGEVSRIISEMTKLNESGQSNDMASEVLNSNFKFHRSQAEKYANNRAEAWNRFNESMQNFQRLLLMQLRRIGAKQIPVMIEIRRDLGLDSNLPEIEVQMKEQWSRMEARFNALIDSLKNG